jgi:hypothetical protein
MARRVRALVTNMLWYKGWLETRWRLLGSVAFFLLLFAYAAIEPPAFRNMRDADAALAILRSMGMTYAMAMICVFLSGAGIDTKPAFKGSKGLHESRVFTLSLPVTRLRLLAVRAGLGWLEMAIGLGGISFGTWLVFAPLRNTVTAEETLRYTVAIITCASGMYAGCVLLATFLDGVSKLQVSIVVFAMVWLVLLRLRLHTSVESFWSMAQDTGLPAFTMPWTAMGISLAAATILFLMALRIVRTREY